MYGQALYALAQAECLSDAIFRQLQLLKECFEAEPEYVELLSCAALSKQERCQLVDDLGFFLHRYVLNYLKIMTEKGYLRHFSDSFSAYQLQYYHDKGILSVTAVTAFSLSPLQNQRLRKKLAVITRKDVLLSNRVDEALLGGIRLEFDSNQLEDTISQRLETVRQLLKNTKL